MATAFATIFTRSHAASARCLAASLQRVHPEVRLFALAVDGPGSDAEPWEPLEADALGVPELDAMRFAYDAFELCCALKPHLMRHLLDRGFDSVVYLDADMLVLERLDAALARLADAALLLTPHALVPFPEDGKRPDAGSLLVSGVFNAGLVGARPAAREFLDWWATRTLTDCVVEPERGLFVDQKLLDLAPEYVSALAVLRDPGYNVAYWNLHERPVSLTDGRFLAGGSPLVCFHFSGYDPAAPEVVSRHQDRFSMAEVGDAALLFTRYREELAAQGHEECRQRRYGFGAFDDGAPIPSVLRRCFRRHRAAWGKRSPFVRADLLVLCLRRDADGLSPLFREMLSLRPDVARAFPDPAGEDRSRFAEWLRVHGRTEFGIEFSI